MVDEDEAWAAFERRDRAADGRYVGAVRTTRIYCKPSCPARRPKRENVEFFADGADARAAGYRACLRCLPDDVSREELAVARARELLAGAEPPALAALAAAVGYAPHHFLRLFKRATGCTPAAFARDARAARAAAALPVSRTVTEAIYEAGYGSASAAYADLRPRLGTTPQRWRARLK